MSQNQGKPRYSIQPEQKYSLILLVKEIFTQLNEIVSLKRKGFSADISMHLLREMCSVLRELQSPLEEAYFQVLLSFADKSPSPPIPILDELSAHAGIGAKRRLIRSLRGDLVANA